MNGNGDSVSGSSNHSPMAGAPNMDQEDEYDPDGLYGSDHGDDPRPSAGVRNGDNEGDRGGMDRVDNDDAMSIDGNSDVTVETPPRPPEMKLPPPGLATMEEL